MIHKRLIATVLLFFILIAMIWRWETADESMKDILFYSFLVVVLVQNIWGAIRQNTGQSNDS